MPKFETIKAGDILYDVGSTRMGNTRMTQKATWRVLVISVDPDKRQAVVSWNSNPAKTYSERHLTRLRRTPPAEKKRY